jgi:anti-sigma factor RsiW
MKQCEDIRERMAFYLDDELRGDDLAAFEAHVQKCATCRDAVASEQQFIESIRNAKPLYSAPTELRARAEAILRDAPPALIAPPELRRRVRQSLWGVKSSLLLGARRRALGLAALVIFVIALAVVWTTSKSHKPTPVPSDFALMAVDTHLRHLRGQLPFEIATESPDEIYHWFEGKVSFAVKLPNYQEASGQEKLYQLEGARLVGFRNDYAAYVAYEMNREPITLVMTSEQVAVPRGGEEIVSKGKTFHYDSIEGLKVITWSDKGLTYALVSDLEERGQQSCVVCHAGTKDRDFIKGLEPAH